MFQEIGRRLSERLAGKRKTLIIIIESMRKIHAAFMIKSNIELNWVICKYNKRNIYLKDIKLFVPSIWKFQINFVILKMEFVPYDVQKELVIKDPMYGNNNEFFCVFDN
jgi:hypothetical protein